jgi:hypothetical protein
VGYNAPRQANRFVTALLLQEITERKRVEEALRESEERYRQLFNHAPAEIYEVDFEKQKWVTVNDVISSWSKKKHDAQKHVRACTVSCAFPLPTPLTADEGMFFRGSNALLSLSFPNIAFFFAFERFWHFFRT